MGPGNGHFYLHFSRGLCLWAPGPPPAAALWCGLPHMVRNISHDLSHTQSSFALDTRASDGSFSVSIQVTALETPAGSSPLHTEQ